MSLIDMPSIRSRSRITASCVEPGQIATFLPFRSLMVLMPVLTPAITAMPPLLALATIMDRLVGGGAKKERGDAMDAGLDCAGEHRVLAVGRTFERHDLHLVAGRRELLVEVGGDAVDELERSDLQDLILGMAGAASVSDSAATRVGSASLIEPVASMETPCDCGACPAACSISLA